MPHEAHACTRTEPVTASVYQVPTDQPEADATLVWSATTLVAAQVHDAGWGTPYPAGAGKPLIEDVPVGAVTGRSTLDAPRAAGDGTGGLNARQ